MRKKYQGKVETSEQQTPSKALHILKKTDPYVASTLKKMEYHNAPEWAKRVVTYRGGGRCEQRVVSFKFEE
jgi:hypothetical protein